MECPKCNSQLLLDHVVETDDKKEFWYTCINPRCSEKGIAFNPSGGTTKSTIKTAE